MQRVSRVWVISFCVVGLLVSLAFIPCVEKVRADDGGVEVMVEGCGFPGFHNRSIKLTSSQAHDLQDFFVQLQVRLGQARTKQEMVSSIRDIFSRLSAIGLLPSSRSVKYVEKLMEDRCEVGADASSIVTNGLAENRHCVLVGAASDSTFWGLIPKLMLNSSFWYIFAMMFLGIYSLYAIFKPCNLFGDVTFGGYTVYSMVDSGKSPAPIYHSPSVGWIWTTGNNGVVQWNQSFYGNIGTSYFLPPALGVYTGATGFTGFRISGFFVTYFMFGIASHVKLGSSPPYSR